MSKIVYKDEFLMMNLPAMHTKGFRNYIPWLRSVLDGEEVYVSNNTEGLNEVDTFLLSPHAVEASNGKVELPRELRRVPRKELNPGIYRLTTEILNGKLRDQLKVEMSDVERDRDFLTRYVGELEKHRNEEDVFIRLAFEDVNSGGAGRAPHIVSVYSQMYEPLDSTTRRDVRAWWHEKTRREASQYDDLRERLRVLA